MPQWTKEIKEKENASAHQFLREVFPDSSPPAEFGFPMFSLSAVSSAAEAVSTLANGRGCLDQIPAPLWGPGQVT